MYFPLTMVKDKLSFYHELFSCQLCIQFLAAIYGKVLRRGGWRFEYNGACRKRELGVVTACA